MNRKDVIKVLKMENDLITFDPMTGEEIDVKCLNELNIKCYIAHEEAIEFLKQSIPIEWIKEHYAYYGIIKTLIEEWEKENETNRH